MFVPIKVSATAGDQLMVLSDRFIEFKGELDNLSVPLSQIGENLRANITGQFATEGQVGISGKWAPLSATYGAWKERHAPGTPILVGLRPGGKGQRPQTYSPSGRMKYEVLDPAATHVEPMRMLYAPTSNIAGYHQTGTSRMPARPLISLYPSTLRQWDRYFAVWLDKLIKGIEA
jgi:hypothetical protein